MIFRIATKGHNARSAKLFVGGTRTSTSQSYDFRQEAVPAFLLAPNLPLIVLMALRAIIRDLHQSTLTNSHLQLTGLVSLSVVWSKLAPKR